jgi:hypothetical protein
MRKYLGLSLMAALCSFPVAGIAQQGTAAVSTAVTNNTVVPRVVNYSGIVADLNGKPLTGVVGVTFYLYKDSQGGAPLWMETQSVQLEKSGHYSVVLGSTTSQGLPQDVFASGEARWLGVQVAGQPEQPRVLLVAVPYAMKAADAETIGGLPPSAFVLANPRIGSAGVIGASAAPTPSTLTPNAAVTGTGTVGAIPLWDTTSDIVSSIMTQTGSGSTGRIGINTATPAATLDVKGSGTIRGTLGLPSSGVATATAGKNSYPLILSSTAFNSGTAASVTQTFRLQTEPAGNNSDTPSGKLNLLFYSGTSTPTETGLSIASNGQITFAPGQSFPGTGTITGVTAGSGLVGGGRSGNVSLGLPTTCANSQILKWNGSAWACSGDLNSGGTIKGVTAGTGLTGGGTTGTVTLNLDTTKVPLLSNTNQFTSPNSFSSTGFGQPTLSVSNFGVGDGIDVSSASNAAISTTNSPIGVNAAGGNYPIIGTEGLYEGVYGDSYTNANFTAGIVGMEHGPTAATIGVFGQVDSLGGWGVYGQNQASLSYSGSTNANPAGVWADGGSDGISLGTGVGLNATADIGPAVVANNRSDQYPTLVGQNSDPNGYPFSVGNTTNDTYCEVDPNGNLLCSGSKNAVVKIDGGGRRVALAAIESPKNWFEDFGSAQLMDGVAVVTLEPDFAQTVNTAMDYKVFPVPNGDCKGLYVTHKTATSFEVRELGGGTSGVTFDYRITALRKNYENVRLADHTKDPVPSKMTPKGMTTPGRFDIKKLIPPTVTARSAAIRHTAERNAKP